jgi:NADH-quinone oxidoreductase subunit L
MLIPALFVSMILLPWIGAVVVWFTGDAHERLQHNLAVTFSVLSAAAAVILVPLSQSWGAHPVLSIPTNTTFGNFSFMVDGLGMFLAAVATVIGSLAVIFSVDYMKGEAQLGRYYAFVLFFIGAMVGLVTTANVLLIFAFWEITALCSYALISFHSDDPKAVAGGIKALIITQIGGIGLLVGALLFYSNLHTLDINVIIAQAGKLPANVLALVAFAFLIAAAAKSAQFPFQTWLPDAMEAPTPISALIHAATMVNAGVYLLARFYPAFAGVPGWRLAVMIVGMLSALMAAVMALVANDLKRVLAYSTVSQLGFMVYAVGAGGIFASQYHLMSHSVFKALLFLGAGAVIHSVGTRDMRLMGGLRKKMPLVSTVFIIGALALAGLPILNGFWSKELVLEAGLQGGPAWIFAIMLVVVGLTALYTFRCVWLVFFGEPRSELHAHDAGVAMRVALVPLAFGSLTTWLLAGPFIAWLAHSVPSQAIEIKTGAEIFMEILSAPATWGAIVMVLLGLAAWWWRDRLSGLVQGLRGVAKAATDSFGFEAINRSIVTVTQGSAEALRATQTGVLNWNIFGIVAGLVIILVILALGA